MKSYSKMKVYPINWETSKKSISKDWIVRYVFTDIKGISHNCSFKGMNHLKEHTERVSETKRLIQDEQYLLDRGYNPKTQEYESHKPLNVVTEDTSFINAMNISLEKVKVSENTRESMKDPVKLIIEAANKTGKASLKISEVRKRDVRIMLDYLIEKGYSNDRYNRVKSNIGILYNYLVDLEIFEVNYIHFIKKLPHTPRKSTIYRDDDKKKLKELKNSNYKLWRFLAIYYCSQSRITELRNLKLKDIVFNKQYFTIFEKKGKRYHEVIKPININVSKLWLELLNEAKPEDIFVFSNDLSPGIESCTKNSICNNYKLWVKKKLGINIDMRTLRHTFANDITSIYGIDEAQKALGHTNQKTTRIYAIDYAEQLLEKQKNLKIGL